MSTGNTILFDPYPRPLDLIFSAEDRARLEQLGHVVYFEGERAPEAFIEEHLPDAVALIGQTPLDKAGLDRRLTCASLPTSKATFNPMSITPSVTVAVFTSFQPHRSSLNL